MPLFDPDSPDSPELGQAVALRSRLSECASAQKLFGVSSEADALTHISLGPGSPSQYGENVTLAELEQRNAWAQILPPIEEGADWFEDDAAESSPFRESFDFEAWFRWQVPAADLDNDTEEGVFNYFWDVLAKFPNDLRTAVRASEQYCPRVRGVRRTGLRFGAREEESEQGIYLQAEFLVSVGDLSE